VAATATGSAHQEHTDAMAVRGSLVDEAGSRTSGPPVVTGTVKNHERQK
jgi:hypothetical protein